MIYLDTGCLLKLYYPEPESERVAALVHGQAIAYVPLHALEVANALALKQFRKEAKHTQVAAVRMLVESDIRSGNLHRPSTPWDDVFREAQGLSETHTRKLGCRSLDILHCAVARALTISHFVTTDSRQRRLAVAMGLTCPRV
jgi:predicted nucleic acid-binding protein